MAIELGQPEIWMERCTEQAAWPGNPLVDEDRDRARLIHSAAFRRLQAKTQVLGIGESDFHRTRLTHTMEVAQIGRVIVLRLLMEGRFQEYRQIVPSPALIEAICFAHDLGHPPFGHCGETALNHAMRGRGGFEGNGQSLRIVSCLEPHTRDRGLNLTRRVLMGILKYPSPFSKVTRLRNPGISPLTRAWKPPKCFLDTENDLVNWVLRPLSEKDRSSFSSLASRPTDDKHGTTAHRSLDTSILNLADDIAYGMHDLEDGIALKLITKENVMEKPEFRSLDWAVPFGVQPDNLIDGLFGREARERTRKEAVSSLLNALVCSVVIKEDSQFECPLLRYCADLDPAARAFLKVANELIHDRIIKTQEVQTLEYRGMRIVSDLFCAIVSDPESLLGETQRDKLKKAADPFRVSCDFVAGMTDVYANRFHERLYGSRQASVFERL